MALEKTFVKLSLLSDIFSAVLKGKRGLNIIETGISKLLLAAL